MSGPPPSSGLLIEAVTTGTVVRVTSHAIDEAAAGPLAERLLELTATMAAGPLYLHLGAVDCLTSALLGKLVMLNRVLRARGGRLALLALKPAVYQVFHAARLTDLLDIRRGLGASAGREPAR